MEGFLLRFRASAPNLRSGGGTKAVSLGDSRCNAPDDRASRVARLRRWITVGLLQAARDYDAARRRAGRARTLRAPPTRESARHWRQHAPRAQFRHLERYRGACPASSAESRQAPQGVAPCGSGPQYAPAFHTAVSAPPPEYRWGAQGTPR
jgi:hypothetical protein